MDYLLPELRFKGNAYGVSFSCDSRAAPAAFGSFREPHVARTLGVFDATDHYVAEAEWSQLDIDRAIIATAKGDFRPVRLGQAARAALQHHLSGTIPELRHEPLRVAAPRHAAGGEGSARRSAGAVRPTLGLRGIQPPGNQELDLPLQARDILRPGP